MPAPRDEHRIGIAWALASAVAAALFAIPWKLANDGAANPLSLLVMLAVAAAANSTFAVWQRLARGAKRWRPTGLELRVAALLSAFTLFGNHASAEAISELSAATANLLLRAEVLAVPLLARALLGERVDGRYWIGAAIALLGLVVLQGPPAGPGGLPALRGGAGYGIAAALSFSAIAVLTRRAIHRIDAVLVNAIRLWLAVVLWLPIHGFAAAGAPLAGDRIAFAALAGLAGPFLGRLCLMISARYVEARISALVALATPVLTLIAGLLLLSDWPGRYELLGGGIMLAGIAVPLLPGRAAKPDTQQPGDERGEPERR